MASTSNISINSENNAVLIDQFCSVTGADKDKAMKMLEVCNWNLEMAINMHVDSCPENPQNSTSNGTDEDNIRDPIPQSRAVLMEEDMNFHYGLRRTKRKPHAVFDGLRDFQAEAQLQGQNGQNESSMSKKRRTLEDLFRPPLDIMYRGSFESARDFGQVSNKWLLVNLQNAQEFSCQILNRDVWSNKTVKSLIKENFVFWQIYLDSSDGQRYTQFYKAFKFPHISVLDPQTGEKLVEWNEVTSTSIIELITLFLREHCAPDGSRVTVDQKRRFSVIDQSEEEQLKAALAASLKDVKPSTIVIDDDSDIETFDSDSESTNDKVSIVNLNSNENSNDVIDVVGLPESLNQESSLPAKSWKDFLGSKDDQVSDLVLRLPDGKKEQVSWPCTSKLECLLLYVEEIGYALENYELVTNYPRRNICQLDKCKSLQDVDLFPREMIFVQLKNHDS